MSEQPYDGGDLSYDEAHAARDVPPPARRERQPSAAPPRSAADADGDYSYDLAHDVPSAPAG